MLSVKCNPVTAHVANWLACQLDVPRLLAQARADVQVDRDAVLHCYEDLDSMTGDEKAEIVAEAINEAVIEKENLQSELRAVVADEFNCGYVDGVSMIEDFWSGDEEFAADSEYSLVFPLLGELFRQIDWHFIAEYLLASMPAECVA
ncbi:MAG: hypothetical protein HYX69_14735 [Planctomycetia bacterium]|nr:hypothetical protein [Planctomycetia bacterium]